MDAAYVTTKGQLVVPARLRRKYGIKAGTKVFFEERDGEIVFRPVTPEYIRHVCGMLESPKSVGEELLTTRSQDKEAEARLEKLGSR
jgi:AbrB family looped-hinge helix DNA binding protein